MNRYTNESEISEYGENKEELPRVLESLSADLLSGRITSRDALQRRKMEVVKNSDIDFIPSNSAILNHIREHHGPEIERVLPLLLKKPSRTLSGVAVVAVMTSPHSCPHGRCVFCPGGDDQDVPTPQSYTGKEPAAMRGEQHGFDPQMQVKKRISQLEKVGHPTDKVEMIMMGGTLPARDSQYQEDFVKGCLDGLNGSPSETLKGSQLRNESSSHRCIGMTFETRPDYCGIGEIDRMLELGVTRVELGVQTTFDDPLRISRRGHTVQDSIDATGLLKDSGLKVNFHIMPGMPGSTREMDLESARRIFEVPNFRPDMIKVYPTLVIEGTELYDMWRSGYYEPLNTNDAAELVADIKEIIPPWVRIQRVQRDIPSPLVEAGVKKSNLRQLANEELKKRDKRCRCIRCREIGHSTDPRNPTDADDVELVRRDYDASDGKEIFLSYEDVQRDILVGFLRLRIPSEKAHRDEVSNDTALVRELKVFGSMVPLGKYFDKSWQHKGFGGRLLREGEEIARKEWSRERILVTAGIGVKEYYRKAGYEKCGPYMAKKI